MPGKTRIVFEEGNKCARCTASICCTYITQGVDAPRSKDDFDHMLWQMAHKGIQYYKDEDGWFMVVNNECQFLLPTGGCRIHNTRPQVCRDYSNDFCEYDEPAELHFEFYFKDYDSLQDYCRKRFKNWDKRFTSDD